MSKEQFIIQYCLMNPSLDSARAIEPGRTVDNAEKLAEHLRLLGLLTDNLTQE